MMSFIESAAGRIADRIQNIGSSFDPEVLSLPGGSVIALVLWAYGGITLSLRGAARRAALRPQLRPQLPAGQSAPVGCAGCFGRK